MLKIPRHPSAFRKLSAVLIVLVLLPALFYSAYEMNSLTQNERLVERIYRQQLDAILFSVNQYALDIGNKWASEIELILGKETFNRHGGSLNEFARFLSANRGIQLLVFTDTVASRILSTRSAPDASANANIQAKDLLNQLKLVPELRTRLLRLQESGYRKIEGLTIGDSTAQQSAALLFVSEPVPGSRLLAAIVLDAEAFVREVLRQKLDEAAGDEFYLAVTQRQTGTIVYSSSVTDSVESLQTRKLWLFPDYNLGIRMKAQTIEETAHARFNRNLLLLLALDLLVVGGGWIVYRGVRRETELAKLQSDFVANVSHELRTPLSLIRMFAETLEMGRVRGPKKKQEYYATITRETERLTRLVNNILSFSRMESGRKEYHRSAICLNDVVRQVLESYGSHLEELGFALETRLDASLPEIPADKEAVSEALLNVIDNAVKYSGKDKSITIATGMSNAQAFVEVTDHGIGIASHEVEKIFEKFYRVGSGLVHETKGSGLGLTIVRNIIEAHHGEVTVRSKPGEGSTFRLSLPLQS